MAYIGPLPAETFTSFATQEFSTSATTSYTLDHAVTNENEIALFINNVRQQPGSGKAYTATGTALTLSAATASTDTMYAVFLGRALQTVNPADASVGTSQLAATSVTAAKLNNDIISGTTALAEAPADTDEFLVSDAGTLKRIDYSYLKSTPSATLLSTATASQDDEIDFTSGIDSTYLKYRIDLNNVVPGTDGASLYMRFFEGGSIDTNSTYDYFYFRTKASTTTTGAAQGQNQDKMILLDTADSQTGGGIYGSIFIFNPSNTNINTHMQHQLVAQENGDIILGHFGHGRNERTSAMTGVRLYFSSGNVYQGTIKLYGIT